MEGAEVEFGAGDLPPPPPVHQGAGPSEARHYTLKSCAELVATLSDSESLEPKYEAAQEIRIRTKTDAEARAQFGQGGAIPALVGLLRAAVDSDDQNAQETVTCSLLNIAVGDDRNKAAIVEAGGVPLFVELLERLAQSSGKNKSRESQMEVSTRTRVEASGEGGASGSEGVREPENVDAKRKSPLEQQDLVNEDTLWRLQQQLKEAKEKRHRVEQQLKEANENQQMLVNKIRRALETKLKEPMESLLAAEAAALDAKNARAGNEAVVAALLTLSCLGENKACIGSSGAIPPLVELLRSGSKHGRRDALATLLNLANTVGQYDNRFLVVRAGAIPILLYRLYRRLRKMDPSGKTVASSENVVALLYILATTKEGQFHIAHSSNGIADLAEILERGSEKEKEHAVSILSLLCTNRLRYRQLVMNEGVIPALVSLSVADTSTPEAKRVALNLLTQFREQREKQSETTPELSAPEPGSTNSSKRNSHDG